MQPAPGWQLLNLDTRKLVRELLDVTDHTHEPPIDANTLNPLYHRLQGLRVEGAESLVEKQAVQMCVLGCRKRAHLVGQRQCEGERREEALAARQRPHTAL